MEKIQPTQKLYIAEQWYKKGFCVVGANDLLVMMIRVRTVWTSEGFVEQNAWLPVLFCLLLCMFMLLTALTAF